MLVSVVVLAVAVAAIGAALVIRAKLVNERERVAAGHRGQRAGRGAAIAHEELTSTRDALAAETTRARGRRGAAGSAAGDLASVEQFAAAAELRPRRAAANGVEPGVVWPLELQRSDRLWRFSVSPGSQADSRSLRPRPR